MNRLRRELASTTSVSTIQSVCRRRKAINVSAAKTMRAPTARRRKTAVRRRASTAIAITESVSATRRFCSVKSSPNATR